MAIQMLDGTWACSICGKRYSNSPRADSCRESHDMLYIPMSKTELNRLIYALMNEDFDMVPPNLWKTLQKYSKAQVIDG
jgi:hypothetical protein